jgi:hypothetical protein
MNANKLTMDQHGIGEATRMLADGGLKAMHEDFKVA